MDDFTRGNVTLPTHQRGIGHAISSMKHVQDHLPLGRVGEASEAGDVICFLASERASYLTGTAINIDGGTSPVI
ncbi:MAG: SDR family oxidoreductase [Microbacteriaceae bacterium]